MAHLDLTRSRILALRRSVQILDQRLPLARAQRLAVEEEVASLPLPGITSPCCTRWGD